MILPPRNRIVTFFLSVLLITAIAHGQRPDRGEERPGGNVVQYSVFERPGLTPDTTIVDFLYRIPGDQFVFLRDASTGSFVSRGEILVEFRNDDGSRLVRDVFPIEVRRNTQVPEQGEHGDHQGMVTFRLAADLYRLTVEIKDLQSGQTDLDRSRKVEIGTAAGTVGFLSHPLFGYRDTVSSDLVPFNRKGGVLYGSFGGALVGMRIASGVTPSELTWTLEADARSTQTKQPERSGSIDPAIPCFVVPRSEGGRLRYEVVTSGPDGYTTWFVQLPLEKLEPALYTLRLKAVVDGKTITKDVIFPVIWQNQPMSLARFEIAVDALRHIASEEDIDDMIGFMAEDGRERFREFWFRKDPDTTTAYNEVLAEYYRRVDESIRKFSTRGELDGYKSDRGRILILFGTPTHTERVFRPDTGPREIWLYESLKKRFVFIDPSRTGEYELSQTESL